MMVPQPVAKIVSGASARGLPKAMPKGLPVEGQLRSQQFGVTMRFSVTIDACSLGNWASCEGLKVAFSTEKVANGGDYSHQANLPTGIQYEHITLRRAMCKNESPKVKDWLTTVKDKWINYDPHEKQYEAQGGTITLYDVVGSEVYTWKLRGVYPVSWSGPSLNALQAGIALETLVIEHEGFL